MSDTFENTNRETKRETKHTHTHCLGHRGGLAAATVQVRGSELWERVAPSAAPSAHRARRGMGGLRTQGERGDSPSTPAQRREKMCPQISASHLQPRRKLSGGSLSDLCQRGALGGPAGMLSIFTRIKSAMPRPEERSSPRPQNPQTSSSKPK